MTSEEIKNLKRGFGDVSDWTEDKEQFAHRAIDGIWEVAYQIAVMNEHTTSEFEFWERALLTVVGNCAVDTVHHTIQFADELTAAWKARKAHMTAPRQ